MESAPPLPVGPGQRMLAAIVFTDVVSFSARMQDEEEITLSLLERDFAVMRKLCEKHEGSVLKTTGDGLLLYFSSAVLAVAYAQKMQRYFAEKAKTEPAEETLIHRVGIHLGDVFVNNEDVMGDGVNIAARLQAEAEPGGICISQTVYDVVKNKLELDVIKLGPRELKNISDPMPIYRILLEPPKRSLATAGHLARGIPAPVAPPPFLSTTQKVATVVALALALGFAAKLIVQAHFKHQEDLAQSQASQAALGALLAKNDGKPDPNIPDPPPGALTAGGEAQRSDSSHKPEAYSFAEMVRNQPGEKDAAPKTDEWVRQLAAQRLPALLGWLNTAMQRYSKDNPLVARELNGTISKEIKVFAGADRRIYYAEGGAIRPRKWADLKPATLGAIILGAVLDAPAPLAREIEQGAQAFAYFYGLPEMNEELRKERIRHGQK